MSKYAFLVFHKDYEAVLHQLRELGVLHIQERRDTREVEELQQIQQERGEVKTLLRQLRPFAEGQDPELHPRLRQRAEGQELSRELHGLLELRGQKQQELAALHAEASEVALWGDFSPERLEELDAAGYQLEFYSMPLARYTEDFEAGHDVLSIAEQAGRKYFVLVRRAGDAAPLTEADRLARPARSVAQVEELITQRREELETLERSITIEAPSHLAELEQYDRVLENELSFGKAQLQAERLADERLYLLEGFVPTEQAAAFEQALAGSGCYFKQIDFDPATERVPIQLKNNSFARSFEFITQLFSLPNYGEIDQTVLIAPFFMLFFGMCFGDAGYGLILLLASTYFRLRNKGGDNSLLSLGQWLGGGAFVVGLVLGSIFGMELPWARDKDYLFNQDNMMVIAVVIGLIQVFFGKLVGAYKTSRQQGWRYALSGYAWVLLLIGLGLIYLLPKLEIALPLWLQYGLYGIVGLSVLVAFLYNSPGKNPLINVGSGLWTSYNNASGLLGDALSYIRLFAIGLTGSILGSVFNQLAMSCIPSGADASIGGIVIGWVMALFILAFGHTINFGIALIGAFVHPLRLTFVEYYKNSEFEGGGRPYAPLKRK
ncbi:V-type ATP synthase subunit I [Porphyromonas sp. oral taxon 275]|uniref:V-type ATP synthase subunit I n=1 Tax=Porphyromonas sp. oral taxon 275 TaxID=712435 RepID=UPI001BA9F5F2|nr:V-type ATPase 116kDa subunit family protein [Porphyromonas sp. oral taxon 275]QUB43529.1 V-type ATPase subunit domain protein [Porphyromonas sp. oral taxon 275]